jgi:transcriptional regulator with GAF, ATPase, and Fis domain
MGTRIWHYFYGQTGLSEQKVLIAELSAAGVDTVQYVHCEIPERHTAEGFGVVFFSQIDTALQNFLHEASSHGLHRIIMVSVNTELDSDQIWCLMQCGAAVVLSLNSSTGVFGQIAERVKRWKKIDEALNSPRVANNLIGTSSAWIKALRQLIEVATFSDLSILITGESGTGKELAAQMIHSIDPRRKKNKFVVLDCTTIVPELSGSEFFGHVRGAFTGAVVQREGAFSLANGGTLFLDEVGELPLLLQAELLRVVQEQKYKSIGSNVWRKTDFRLICATNRDLLDQERRGNFRTDFYHRIAAWTSHLPPLRERVEDILPLVRHFLERFIYGDTPPALDSAIAEYLMRRDYPGNVRELYNLVRRIAFLHVGDGPIMSGDLPETDRPQGKLSPSVWRDETFEQNIRRAICSGFSLDEIRKAAEDTAEVIALQEAGLSDERNGRIARAARILNINRRTLEMHIKQRNNRQQNQAH